MTTYCRDCSNVHADTRGDRPWNWRCVCVPVPAGYGFVDPEYAPDPPFAKCSAVNTDGECQMFKPLPDPNENEQQPKTRQFQQHRREMKLGV